MLLAGERPEKFESHGTHLELEKGTIVSYRQFLGNTTKVRRLWVEKWEEKEDSCWELKSDMQVERAFGCQHKLSDKVTQVKHIVKTNGLSCTLQVDRSVHMTNNDTQFIKQKFHILLDPQK